MSLTQRLGSRGRFSKVSYSDKVPTLYIKTLKGYTPEGTGNKKKGLLTSGFSIKQDRLDFPRTCYAHFFQIAITAEGNVMFCKNARGNVRKDDKYVLGNINKNTLTEIWNSKNVKEIESWIKPSNCGLFCKNTSLNNALEEFLYPTEDMSPNFVN